VSSVACFDPLLGQIRVEGLRYSASMEETVTIQAFSKKCYVTLIIFAWIARPMTALDQPDMFSLHLTRLRKSGNAKMVDQMALPRCLVWLTRPACSFMARRNCRAGFVFAGQHLGEVYLCILWNLATAALGATFGTALGPALSASFDAAFGDAFGVVFGAVFGITIGESSVDQLAKGTFLNILLYIAECTEINKAPVLLRCFRLRRARVSKLDITPSVRTSIAKHHLVERHVRIHILCIDVSPTVQTRER
jgi:hypothetical protein